MALCLGEQFNSSLSCLRAIFSTPIKPNTKTLIRVDLTCLLVSLGGAIPVLVLSATPVFYLRHRIFSDMNSNELKHLSHSIVHQILASGVMDDVSLVDPPGDVKNCTLGKFRRVKYC